MSFATSALFPLSRTTTGISMPTSCIAETIPSATTSHLTIPPKILIKIDLTFESETIILKASVTLSYLQRLRRQESLQEILRIT